MLTSCDLVNPAAFATLVPYVSTVMPSLAKPTAFIVPSSVAESTRDERPPCQSPLLTALMPAPEPVGYTSTIVSWSKFSFGSPTAELHWARLPAVGAEIG